MAAKMEALQSIKLITIPTWVKFCVGLLLTFLGAINTALLFMGVLTARREGWSRQALNL
jgi:hypothetical protein